MHPPNHPFSGRIAKVEGHSTLSISGADIIGYLPRLPSIGQSTSNRSVVSLAESSSKRVSFPLNGSRHRCHDVADPGAGRWMPLHNTRGRRNDSSNRVEDFFIAAI